MATTIDTSANAKSDADLIKGQIQAKKAQLEAQLKAFDSFNIDKLLAEREQLASKLSDIDAKIAEVRAQLGLTAPKRTRGAGANGAAARTRLSGAEIRSRILKAISEQKYGMSQKEISDRTGISYGSVVAYLKNNAANFKTTGQLKGKKYFLK